MVKVKAHQEAGQKSCVDCHDPHLGKDKFFLKGDIAKNLTAPPGPSAK
jgi:predicted CXXCH cytochrome family protein